MTRPFLELTKDFDPERRERIEQRKIELRHMLKQEFQGVVESSPEICSGQLVFCGTRIPVAVVVEQLRAGVSPAELQEDFPKLSSIALDYAKIQAQHAKGRLQ